MGPSIDGGAQGLKAHLEAATDRGSRPGSVKIRGVCLLGGLLLFAAAALGAAAAARSERR